MLSLKKLVRDYHKGARSYCELLPWFAETSPGIILNIDGTLLAGFKFRGIDCEGKDARSSDAPMDIAERGFSVFDERFTVYTYQERRVDRCYQRGEFAHPVSQMIDEEWRKAVDDGRQAYVVGYVYIVFGKLTGSEGFFDEVRIRMQRGDATFGRSILNVAKDRFFKRRAIRRVVDDLDSLEREFEHKLREFNEAASDIGFQRLVGEDLLAALSDRCNPATQGSRPNRPSELSYLSTLLPSDRLVRSHEDALTFQGPERKRLVSVLSIKGWPPTVMNWHVENLLGADAEYTIAQVYRYLDQEKAKKICEDTANFYRTNAKNPLVQAMEKALQYESSRVDQGMLALADEADAAVAEMTMMNLKYGYMNMTVTVYADSVQELEHSTADVSKRLRSVGYTPVRETLNLLSSFCANIPGRPDQVVRWTLASIANLTDLMPIKTVDMGQAENAHLSKFRRQYSPSLVLFPTESGIPYNFNYHVEDVGNTLIVGPVGAGKTTIALLGIDQWLKYEPCNLIVFDKNYSCASNLILQGIEHIDASSGDGEGKMRINPFRYLANRESWPWLQRWLINVGRALGYELKAEHINTIHDVMQQMAHQSPEYWRMGSFYAAIKGSDPALAAQYEQWVGQGMYGHITDNREDAFSLSGKVCIEMGKLLDDPTLTPILMDYFFHCIEERLDGNTPTLIYLEECWALLKNDFIAARLEEAIRTFRKKLAHLVFTTQSLTELSESEIFPLLVDNIKTKLLLANDKVEVHRDLYRNRFLLNDEQIARIATLIPKQQYYIVNDYGSRVVNARLPERIMATIKSDKASLGRLFALKEKAAPGWEFDFIEEQMRYA